MEFKRQSIRLRGYDYSSNGMYYITICTQDREPLFGEIVSGADLVSVCHLNGVGKMVVNIYNQVISSFPFIESEKYIIMPNHIHCIVCIDKSARADTRSAPTITVSKIIQEFKSKTTVEYIKGVKSEIYPPFNKRIWQRNYYERIIRSEEEHLRIWQYIDENPLKWKEDKYYL